MGPIWYMLDCWCILVGVLGFRVGSHTKGPWLGLRYGEAYVHPHYGALCLVLLVAALSWT